MNYLPDEVSIVLQELPDHISIVFPITGCKHFCEGCHSPQLAPRENGEELTISIIDHYIQKNIGYISALIFFGGETEVDDFKVILDFLCKKYPDIKRCLYSGEDEINNISTCIIDKLDFLKIGGYKKELGGLDKKTTNQRMYNLSQGIQNKKEINYKFFKLEEEEKEEEKEKNDKTN